MFLHNIEEWSEEWLCTLSAFSFYCLFCLSKHLAAKPNEGRIS
jgi:hypothetical protein